MNYLPERKMVEIRLKVINWAFYKQAGKIKHEDYVTMSSLSKAPESYFSERPQETIKTVLHLLTSLTEEEVALQSILVLIDDLTENGSTNRLQWFHDYGKEEPEGVWGPFMELLKHHDRLIVHISAHFLAKLSCRTCERMPSTDQLFYFAFLKNQLSSLNPLLKEYTQNEVHCLQMMLSHEEYRKAFVNIEGIGVLGRLLPRVDFQLQYQIVFCLWVITFNPTLANRMNKYNIIPVLSPILTKSNKEKLTRIILAFFRNLIEKPTDNEIIIDNFAMMIQCDVINTLNNLKQRFIHDDDVREHVIFLHSKLMKAMDEMCTFTQYAAELRSGNLEWTPVHRSNKFWAENALRLNENNYELLRILIDLLESSKESVILAVACQDIGQYVRRYPEGKHVLESLGGKILVLQLLAHDDSDVRYEALMTASQLLKIH